MDTIININLLDRLMIVGNLIGGRLLAQNVEGVSSGAIINHWYLIYRAYDDSGLQSYIALPSDAQVFTNTTVWQKGDYQYAIRIVYPDGRKSCLSASVQKTIP